MIRVETAQQMLDAVEAALPADVFVAAAAVADWRVDRCRRTETQKRRGGAADALARRKIPTFSRRSRKPGR